MGTRNMDFFWQYVNIVIVIVFGCIAMSLSELVARGQVINERVALTGDGGCCIIESLVRPHKPPPFLCRGTPRGICVCFFKASFTCHNLSHCGAIVTTCHATVPPYSIGSCHLIFVVLKVTGRKKRCKKLYQHTSSYISLFYADS